MSLCRPLSFPVGFPSPYMGGEQANSLISENENLKTQNAMLKMEILILQQRSKHSIPKDEVLQSLDSIIEAEKSMKKVFTDLKKKALEFVPAAIVSRVYLNVCS